jgi:hypothetical protein
VRDSTGFRFRRTVKPAFPFIHLAHTGDAHLLCSNDHFDGLTFTALPPVCQAILSCDFPSRPPRLLCSLPTILPSPSKVPWPILGKLLHTLNVSKKAPKSDAVKPGPPIAPRFYLTGACRAACCIYSSRPAPSPTLLMQFQLQPDVDIHYAALSLHPRPLRLPPRASLPSLPGVPLGITST